MSTRPSLSRSYGCGVNRIIERALKPKPPRGYFFAGLQRFGGFDIQIPLTYNPPIVRLSRVRQSSGEKNVE